MTLLGSRTTHVRADCWITGQLNNPTAGNQYNEIFANIVQFLSGPLCAAMGISLVASNYGRNGATGLGFWDQTTGSAGEGAWAVFRWNSSSYGPFDAMFMVVSGGNVTNNSTVPMNVYGFTTPFTNNSHGLVGVSFAATSTNADPWNGTGTFASGVIGNPVWKTDANGKLCVFPRQNAPGGTTVGGSSTTAAGSYATQRNYMMGLDGNVLNDTVPLRMHIIATPDSFTHLLDPGATTSYIVTHFGPWTPRLGLNTPDVQYFLVGSGMTSPFTNVPPLLWTALANTYGTTAASTGHEGGIAHPNAVSGSRAFGISVAASLPTTTYWNNLMSGSGAYDVLPLYFTMYDGDIGIMGTANEAQYVYGVPTHSVTPQSSSVVIGNSTPLSAKWVFPWAGPPPGSLPLSNRGNDT